jgi:predicted metal-dependent phosphoesterase TrpH
VIQPPLRKVDLHVHTVFSNFRHLKILKARDSYNDPMAVYRRCLEAGSDYVAITDHDTIEGALDLLSRDPSLEPSVIVGEEVETWFPETGQWVHVNVLGVDEASHRDIQKARASIYDLIGYLRGKGLMHFLNHPFQSYRLQSRPMDYVEKVLDLFTHVEMGNGTLPPAQNRAAAAILEFGRRLGVDRFGVAGSDAHGLRPIGAFMTMAPGENKSAWIRSVKEGNCLVAGREIGLGGLLGEVYSIVGQYYRHLAAPGGMKGMRLRNLAAAAGFVPVCVAGVPAILPSITWAGTSAVSALVHRSMRRAASRSKEPDPALRGPAEVR